MGKPDSKRSLGRPRRRWEDNIKMDLRDVGCDPRDWIALAEDRDQWRAYVRAVNLRVPSDCVKSKGKLPHIFIPGKTATLDPEFLVEYLPLGRTAVLVPEFTVKDLPLGRIL